MPGQNKISLHCLNICNHSLLVGRKQVKILVHNADDDSQNFDVENVDLSKSYIS